MLNSRTKSGRSRLIAVLVCFTSLASWYIPANAVPIPTEKTDSLALEILLHRFVQSVLPTMKADIDSVHQIAARYEESLEPDGHWPDINYQDLKPNNHVGGNHLTRDLVMAESACLYREAGKSDSELTARTLLALNAWIAPDIQNKNWWWNRIGIPELVGEIAALMRPDLSAPEMNKVIEIMKRSRSEGETGANLTWCAINQVILGCLENSPVVTRTAFDQFWGSIHFADSSSGFDGIQPDFSFHQHGPQLYSGGYGLFFANDIGRFIYVSWGTSYQIPESRFDLYSRFMLDGMRWITWHNILDYSSMGRNIDRPGMVAAPHDWSLGPISPAGPAYSLANVTRLLSTLPIPRHQEYANWSECLNEVPHAKEMTGNKQFWCSDYMVYRTSNFMTSVKMFSTRTINAEVIYGEGRMSFHLSDGANFLYMAGHEYEDIFPCWDWQKVPGTTAEQMEDMNKIEPHAIHTYGKTSFVGGVSDGTCGMCAMHLLRRALEARKAWFFFDSAYVCLGAGITVMSSHDVVTDVNQMHLIGPVLDNESRSPLATGVHDLKNVRWVYHDSVGYVFAKGQKVILSNRDQTGSWADIGSGPKKQIALPVFNLWIEHSKGCKNATYDYVVLPAVSIAYTRKWAENPDLDILSNTTEAQAVYSATKKMAEIAFWSAGTVETPLGTIAVDQPTLLLVKPVGKGRFEVTVSNPRNQPLSVKVQVGRRSVTVTLQGGSAAGSSVSQILDN